MPTQQEIEAIKAAHVESIRQAIARVQPGTPTAGVMSEDAAGIYISPFGAVPDGAPHRTHNAVSATLQTAPRHEAGNGEPSVGPSVVALLLGLFFVYRLLRHLLEE